MVIIQLAGGLGNQMFQYALYLQLKSLGKTVKIDDTAGFVRDAQRCPALSPFGIDYERATAQEMERMLDSSMLPWNRVRRKLCGRKKKAYFEADKRYKPQIMEWDDIYLEGYWQTERYFDRVQEEVRAAYDTDRLLEYIRRSAGEKCTAGEVPLSDCASVAGKKGVSAKNIMPDAVKRQEAQERTEQQTVDQWLAGITAAESVSVHIRRGDYLLPENQALFGGICTEAYYQRAMEQMKQEHPNCRFYVFTNDKQWAKEWITGGPDIEGEIKSKNIEIVDLGEHSDYAEFVLMSRCRHNILANSSFSWWASYLNRNRDKTVLAPERWLNGWDCTDFYRDDMQIIAVDDLP